MSLRDSVLLLPSTVFLVYFYCCFCFHQQNIWEWCFASTHGDGERQEHQFYCPSVFTQLCNCTIVLVYLCFIKKITTFDLDHCLHALIPGRQDAPNWPKDPSSQHNLTGYWLSSSGLLPVLRMFFFFTCVTGFSLNAMYTLVWLADCTALSILENTVM